MKKKVSLYILISLVTFSCTNVTENDLVATTELPNIVTYNNHVKSIIDNNCIVCHSNPPINDAPMSLTTYQNIKSAIMNSDLINRISSQDLGFVMPFGGPRLPQHLIDIVIKWEIDGFLEE